jgi:hypothetical protein
MFGEHRIPLTISVGDLSLNLIKYYEFYRYRRESSDSHVEKILLQEPERIILSPVEPLNLLHRITPYLQIEFLTTVVASPGETQSVFLSFPIEIGVFFPVRNAFDLLDTISLSRKKLTLYGSPRGGHITRYWQSSVHHSAPKTNSLYEGVLKLEIVNEADGWIPVKKIVLDAHGMKIHYKKDMVTAQARMEVTSENKAETEFIESPIEQGMKSSIELFKLGRLAVSSTRYYMGEGI